MRILITGAGGMLGSALSPHLKKEGHQVSATDINITDKEIEFLDVRDYNKLRDFILNFKPELIMHLAAETDLEKCELDPFNAYMTNTIGTQNVALLCQEFDLLMVYISTAGVFDGVNDSYNEFDKPNPINIYGKSKFEGENIVQKLLRRYFIVRAGWMIGGGDKDKKFIMKIIKQINEGKKELHVVDDKYGTPTYTEDFAKCISKLILTKFYGLYHMVCKGSGTRYDVALEIIKFFNKKDITINRINSDSLSKYFNDQFFVQRPRSEIMINLMLELRGINNMRDWRVALREYLENNFFNNKKIEN